MQSLGFDIDFELLLEKTLEVIWINTSIWVSIYHQIDKQIEIGINRNKYAKIQIKRRMKLKQAYNSNF